MTNKWITYVKKIAKEKEINFKEALSIAKKTYKGSGKNINLLKINDKSKINDISSNKNMLNEMLSKLNEFFQMFQRISNKLKFKLNKPQKGNQVGISTINFEIKK